jgi:hypothetical protein
MGDRKLVSRRPDLQFEWALRDGVAPDLVGVRLAIACDGTVERTVATGRFWVFAAVSEESGVTAAGAGRPCQRAACFSFPRGRSCASA